MKNKQLTRDELLKVLQSYAGMIERSGEDFPGVVLDDIHASVKGILRDNAPDLKVKNWWRGNK